MYIRLSPKFPIMLMWHCTLSSELSIRLLPPDMNISMQIKSEGHVTQHQNIDQNHYPG